MTTPTCGSKYTPRSAISFSAASSMPVPCSICMQPGIDGEPDRLARLRVHHRPQPLRFRLAAERLELLARHRLLAAASSTESMILTTSARSFFSSRTIWRSSAGVPTRGDLHDRGQDARARKHAARDRVAQIDVAGLTRTLNGRESGHQREVRVLGGVEDRLVRASAARGSKRPFDPKCQPMCTCTSINPGSSVACPRSMSTGPELDGSIAAILEPLTTTVAFESTCPVPSITRAARMRTSRCCA